MLSWWDCMRWWDSSGAWDGTTSWLMVLPMMLWPILIIGGVIAVVMLLLRAGRTDIPRTWPDNRRQTAFDILRERFARGEIDRHEYEERKGLLSQP
jgi:putative membrane protein